MLKREVEEIIKRKPFMPLTIYRNDGSKVPVAFSHVAIARSTSLIVFTGVKREGSHQATGFEEIPYDAIERIEPRATRGGQRRQKAS